MRPPQRIYVPPFSMDFRQSPLLLGFSLGNWFRTDVRVSFFFPLLLVGICFQLGWKLGGMVSAILVASVLIHEFAHVFGARRTGGAAHEIILWPLGGLAMTSPAFGFRSEFWTVAAGPISNALQCLVVLPFIVRWDVLSECLGVVTLPPVGLTAQTLARDLTVLTFAVNYHLLLVNLLPIFPLDGGQILLAMARRYRDPHSARMMTMWVGVIACFILMFTGLLIKSQEVMFLGCILVVFALHEFYSLQMRPREDDSFLGYDFSQGYTSLERNSDQEPVAPRTNPLQRWKEKREEERRQREEVERVETERLLDELLQKVHEHGMNSLTDSERVFLTKASARYRR